MFLNTCNSLRDIDMTNESFYRKKIVWRAAFFRSEFLEWYVLAKTVSMQSINAPSVFNLVPSNLARS